jgi:shikimate dehydrogenase
MSHERIPLAGVIGNPIAHSRSPQVHGYWLKSLNLRGHYIPMHVTEDNLKEVLHTLPNVGFVGVNITIPHKEVVLQIADRISDRAKAIGAANTLFFSADGEIFADNTDGYGFIENLHQGARGWDPKVGAAALLGAGGAARAVICSLLEAEVPEILISNRTIERAHALRQEFGPRLRVVEWSQAGSMIAEADLVVNTTSLGMVGNSDLNVPLDGLHEGQIVTDLVYNPLETPILQAARLAGCTTVDGLGMLLHQAVPGFERWFGQRPEVTPQLRAAALK